MLLNRCNITISLCFPTSLLTISAICEFTLGECLVYCSLHITSFYRYTFLLSIKLSMVAITVLHRCMTTLHLYMTIIYCSTCTLIIFAMYDLL
ncbi:hypothetical protein WN943_007687 [Citrus x changshan-huyou]